MSPIKGIWVTRVKPGGLVGGGVGGRVGGGGFGIRPTGATPIRLGGSPTRGMVGSRSPIPPVPVSMGSI